MFLKSIEIRGFKSFADKTELNFKKGVTAVVGPNGSGKSNISDAIRWVLGEQSVKTLRGGKMEDVIFAGTQYRKPVGLAQVALTLDNSSLELPIEYNDVTISRRLYRSGESEYYINNTPCRLKDIHELFMDTGIGKEGYSIIGQGKIDAILSGKPEERRSLLEEAAGIVKFKSRKEEAQKKLENTEQNLIRINDIIGTYEERLEPLRIDNEKAKEFVELSSELNSLELSLLVNSIKELDKNIEYQKQYYDSIIKEVQEFEKEKEQIKLKLSDLETKLEEHNAKNDKDRESFYKNKERLQELHSEINLLNERSANLENNIIEYNKETVNLIDKLNILQEDKERKEKELSIKQTSQNNVNNEILELESGIQALNNEINLMDTEILELRENAIEILRQLSDVKNSKTVIENDIRALGSKMDQLNTACENYNNSIKINTTTVLMLRQEEDKFKLNITQHEDKIKENRKAIFSLNNNLAALDKTLREKSTLLNKLEANHNMLINLENQYEGYNKSVKNLMQNIKKGSVNVKKDSCHVLGEIIKVPRELEISIEIALGGGISDVITENEDIAKFLIGYLKQHNLGRATFLPLNIIRGRKIQVNSNIKSIEGYIGIGSDLVEYESRFTSALDYVLGRTIICRDMDSALKVAKSADYSFKIVTLQGEVVNPGGALTGGSVYHKNVSIIGRKREIDEIQKNILELKESLDILNKEIEIKKANLKNLDDECLNLRDEIHYENLEITKVQGKISSIESENERLDKSLKISEQEIELVRNKINTSNQSLKEKENLILDLTEKENNAKARVEFLETHSKDKVEDYKNKKEILTELKIKKAQIDEFVTNEIKNLVRISKDIEDISSRIKGYNDNIERDKGAIVQSQSKIEENHKLIENINSIIDSMKQQFEKGESIKIELKNSISTLMNDMEQLEMVIQKKEADKNKVDIGKAKYEVEKETLYTKLNEELNLTYVEALEKAILVENPEEFKRKIYILKRKITELGTVNLGAIEEYEEVKNKFEFMSTQREDLTQAKEELLNVIEEMTGKMKQVFNENFKILRGNFNETFKELFKGGSADLILSEGDELTANIDINVQPPGKKLQNINLMSGGEKVLSAIALLFAILKMKPTPFCILDEIEAALDDANVYRYAEFLNKFASNIQFIVITHRKGTMEASDVLYGVTMEEKGVSKIVSVDLSA